MSNKTTRLGQIYYGRSRDGYGILGASPSGRPFADAVAALCRAVGSPDRPGDIHPFLLSKRESKYVIMVHACRDEDPTGRATLFFHALVADVEFLRASGLDAFAFADAGIFSFSCPSREPPDLVFPDERTPPSRILAARSIDLPATIFSDLPLDTIVRRELSTEALNRSWATFSYNPLPGFDLCVLSSHSPRPGGGTQYAFNGAGLHRLSSNSSSMNNGGAIAKSPKLDSSCKSPSVALLVLIVANAVLVLALLLRTDDVAEMTESAARVKWEEQWKLEWEKSLPTPTPAMTESEAKAKWEEQWKLEWEKLLRRDFQKTIHESGGEWPILFDNDNSPFGPSIRSAQTEPDDARASARWKLYRSCKACADFIQNHLNP